MNEWNDELRNMIYEGELDVAARSNIVTSLDGIIGAHAQNNEQLSEQIASLTKKLDDSRDALTRLALENSKHIAAGAVKAAEEIVEEVVEEVEEEESLSELFDELEGVEG